MNPSNGRFTQQDAFAGSGSEPITLHKYLYANSSPVMFTDPSGNFGLSDITAAFTVRAVLGNMAAGGALGAIDAALASDSTGQDVLRGAAYGAVVGGVFGPAAKIQALAKPLAVVFTGLGIAGTIQSASDGNYAQAAFRGVASVLGAYMYLRSTTRASNVDLPDFDAFSAPDQGFSGVWHSESGKIIVKPSTAQAPTPGGFVPRRGGHAEIAAELGGRPEHLFGFTLIKLSDGRVKIEFFSRGVNGQNPSFPGNVVPEALQPVIAAAIQGASRKQIVIEP